MRGSSVLLNDLKYLNSLVCGIRFVLQFNGELVTLTELSGRVFFTLDRHEMHAALFGVVVGAFPDRLHEAMDKFEIAT